MSPPDPPPELGRPSILSIIGFAVLCGSVSLIYPFGRDQGNYAYAGWVLLEGGMPYRDVFVFKPPMTVVVHGLAMGSFGVNTWAIRVLDIGWTAATALVVAALARELWRRRDVALAAGLACPLLYYQIDYWMIAQTDGWMTLPCALAVWAVLRGGRAAGRTPLAWWAGAGALAGIAVLFKYTAALIGIPMLLALAWVASQRGRRAWIGIVPMALGGLLVLAACWLWLASTGAWSDFVDSQFRLVPDYVARRHAGETPWKLVRWLFNLRRSKADLIPMFWAGLGGLAAALVASRPRTRTDALALTLLVVWWLVAAANVIVQGKFFDYHYLPMLAPSASIAGLGAAALLHRALSRIDRRELRTLAVTALLALVVVVTPIGGRFRDLGRVAFTGQTIDQYIASRREYAFPDYNVREVRQVAKLLRETTTPEQRVFLWGYEPTINVRAQRRTVSRFLYNFPFRMGEVGSKYEAELMSSLRDRPPDVVVVTSGDRFPGLVGTYKDSAMLLAEFHELNTFVTERYRPAETVGRYSLWRLAEPSGPQNE